MTAPPGGPHGDAPGDDGARADARGRRRRPVAVPVAALLAGAALGAIAALGGFADAPAAAPDQLGPGATVDQGRARTEFVEAAVRQGRPGIGLSDRRYLEIVMRITNQSDRTTSVHGIVPEGLTRIRADDRAIKPSHELPKGARLSIPSEGGRSVDQLHPGVPTEVVLAFELAGDAPKQVQIDVGSYEWRRDFSSETFSWIPVGEFLSRAEAEAGRQEGEGGTSRFVPEITAQVTLPVKVEES